MAFMAFTKLKTSLVEMLEGEPVTDSVLATPVFPSIRPLTIDRMDGYFQSPGVQAFRTTATRRTTGRLRRNAPELSIV